VKKKVVSVDSRLNNWADGERAAGRTCVFESPSDYVAHVRMKIANAKQAANEGRVVSHEEVKRRFVK
jgi:hypothetical protein